MAEYRAHDSAGARFAADGTEYRCTRRGKANDGRWYLAGSLYTAAQVQPVPVAQHPLPALRDRLHATLAQRGLQDARGTLPVRSGLRGSLLARAQPTLPLTE